MPFRVVQEPKHAEKLVGILCMKSHAIIANTEYELTFGTSDQKIGLMARLLVALRV